MLLVVNLVSFMSFQILVPLLPVYGLRFSTSESLIGFLAAAIALAALIIRPFTGFIADRYDCNKIIVISQLGTAVIVAFYIIAPHIGTLIVMRFAQGILFGFSTTVVMTAGIRTMPEEKINQGVGILGATGFASQAVAPMIGLWIVGKWDYPVLFAFTSALALIASIIALVMKIGKPAPRKEEKEEDGKSAPCTERENMVAPGKVEEEMSVAWKEEKEEAGKSAPCTERENMVAPGKVEEEMSIVWKEEKEEAGEYTSGKEYKKEKKAVRISPREFFAVEAIGFAAVLLLFGATTSLPASFIVIYAQTRGIPHSGLYFTIFAIVLVASRVFGAGLLERFSLAKLLTACAICCAAGLAIIGASSTFPPLIAAAIVMGLGYGVSCPAILTTMIRIVQPERRGTASATYYMALDLAYVVGPVVMGFIAEASDYNMGFFFFVAPMLAAIPLTLFVTRRQAAL